MIVCICHRVSDRDIGRAVREGCDSFDAVKAELRVATACGACTNCAQAVFERACSANAPSLELMRVVANMAHQPALATA